MQLVRTTLRLDKRLKKEAERLALEKETSLQKILNEALDEYLKEKAMIRVKKNIKFITHDIGAPLDNLRRADYYDEPKL